MRKSNKLISMFAFVAMFALVNLYCTFNSAYTQTNYQWAKGFGSSGTEIGLDIAVDNNENIIVAGYFNDSVTFGSYTLYGKGGEDVFIVKMDAGQNVLWAHSIGGSSNDGATAPSSGAMSLALDANNNIYLCGTSSSSQLFVDGANPLNNFGSFDIFLIKLDVNGNVSWFKNTGSANLEEVSGIAVKNDRIYLCGRFFNSADLFGQTINSFGGDDIFIASLDTSGNRQWVANAGGTSGDAGTSVAVDNSGNIYVTGRFSSLGATFGSLPAISADGIEYDVFLAKYDASGNAQWVVKGSGTSHDRPTDVATDPNGNVVITGYSISNSITFGTTTLTRKGIWDLFVASYTSGGSFRWARGFGNNGYNYGYGIATDSQGDIYITGGFGNSIQFDGSTLVAGNSSQENFFLVKLDDTTGTARWSLDATSSEYVWGQAVATASNGNIYATGSYEKATDFGSFNLPSNGGNEVYGEDVFVAKVAPNTGTPIAPLSLKEKNTLQVYPNLLSGNSPGISLLANEDLYDVRLMVHDNSGKNVYESFLSRLMAGSPVTINLPVRLSGIYFLTIKGNHHYQQVKKLIFSE